MAVCEYAVSVGTPVPGTIVAKERKERNESGVNEMVKTMSMSYSKRR